MKEGQLSIVGSGIMMAAHLTREAEASIRQADQVFALVPEPLGMHYLTQLNPRLTNLADYYFHPDHPERGKDRLECYRNMANTITRSVADGKRVCAVFYGHPAVFVHPAHLCIEYCNAHHIPVRMLPGISAEDCLYADLGVDPGEQGVQSLEASQFVFCRMPLNIYSPVILWQLGTVGDTSLRQLKPAANGLAMLQAKLKQFYPDDHLMTLYEAPTLPIMEARIENFMLSALSKQEVTTASTLWIPALEVPPIDYPFCEAWQIAIEELADESSNPQ